MVLIFALWNDSGAFMNWLDAGTAGPCNMKEGRPGLIKNTFPSTQVTFSNIKWVRKLMVERRLKRHDRQVARSLGSVCVSTQLVLHLKHLLTFCPSVSREKLGVPMRLQHRVVEIDKPFFD
jgi:hypothetical protein